MCLIKFKVRSNAIIVFTLLTPLNLMYVLCLFVLNIFFTDGCSTRFCRSMGLQLRKRLGLMYYINNLQNQQRVKLVNSDRKTRICVLFTEFSKLTAMIDLYSHPSRSSSKDCSMKSLCFMFCMSKWCCWWETFSPSFWSPMPSPWMWRAWLTWIYRTKTVSAESR